MIQQSCSWAFSQEKWKHVHNETCARMFITALLTIDPNWQKNKYAKTRELINQGIIISWEALSSKREWTSITYNNFDESPKYYSNLKRPDTKECILYEVQKQAKLICDERRQDSSYLWEGGINDWEGGEMGILGR